MRSRSELRLTMDHEQLQLYSSLNYYYSLREIVQVQLQQLLIQLPLIFYVLLNQYISHPLIVYLQTIVHSHDVHVHIVATFG